MQEEIDKDGEDSFNLSVKYANQGKIGGMPDVMAKDGPRDAAVIGTLSDLGVGLNLGDSKPDPQLDNAKAIDMTWTFEGKEYPMFVANRTGSIGVHIKHPVTLKTIGILSADFLWTDIDPFLDHLDLKIRDEKSSRDEESTRKRANYITQNSRLFRELVQGGSLIKVSSFDEQSDPIAKTRDEMLAYAPETQSNLIDEWLGNFHIERFFEDGSDDVEALLMPSDTIKFVARIGDHKDPAHVLVFEFNVPSPDARRSYENDTFSPGSRQDGDVTVSTYKVDNKRKLQFAKKHLISCDGVVTGADGVFDVPVESLYRFNAGDQEALKTFRTMFNPHWLITLADHLAGAFNLKGK